MKLLLTGATGFVGRNALLHALPHYEEIFLPVRNPEKLRSQLAAEGLDPAHPKLRVLSAEPKDWPAFAPDHAILGAGVLFARNRGEYFATNVDWTLRVLQALPETCRAILLSSLSAGGPTPPEKSARSGTDPDAPITWYGESKLALESAVRSGFPRRALTILRPPMILGPRDTATLPLFRMAAHPVRIKPGWKSKTYSFLAVDDLVDALFATLGQDPLPAGRHYIAAPQPITDRELIAGAAATMHARGLTLPVPQAAVRLLSILVDAVPALRASTPSLTRDRAREIWPDRWVADGADFSRLTGWQARRGLAETLQATHAHYVRGGNLR